MEEYEADRLRDRISELETTVGNLCRDYRELESKIESIVDHLNDQLQRVREKVHHPSSDYCYKRLEL